MILEFNTQELVEKLKLDDLDAGTTVIFMVTGNLREDEGALPIQGEDCVAPVFPFRIDSAEITDQHGNPTTEFWRFDPLMITMNFTVTDDVPFNVRYSLSERPFLSAVSFCQFIFSAMM